MKERVARAICTFGNVPAPYSCCIPRANNTSPKMCRRFARFALEAMREATEAMQDAGAFPRENRKPVADVWRAMIEAALGEDSDGDQR